MESYGRKTTCRVWTWCMAIATTVLLVLVLVLIDSRPGKQSAARRIIPTTNLLTEDPSYGRGQTAGRDDDGSTAEQSRKIWLLYYRQHVCMQRSPPHPSRMPHKGTTVTTTTLAAWPRTSRPPGRYHSIPIRGRSPSPSICLPGSSASTRTRTRTRSVSRQGQASLLLVVVVVAATKILLLPSSSPRCRRRRRCQYKPCIDRCVFSDSKNEPTQSILFDPTGSSALPYGLIFWPRSHACHNFFSAAVSAGPIESNRIHIHINGDRRFCSSCHCHLPSPQMQNHTSGSSSYSISCLPPCFFLLHVRMHNMHPLISHQRL